MAVIYLVHDVHGAKVAISEAEAVCDEEIGWERYNPSDNAASAVNEMQARKSRRRATQE
jgi:hypothetical protein